LRRVAEEWSQRKTKKAEKVPAMVDEKRVQASIDRSEIINLVSKSIITRDSGWWDQLAECYHSEAEFTSSWWQGKPKDFVKAASKKLEVAREEGGEQKHMTSNHWIEISGDRATAECDLILFMRRVVNGVDLDFATFSRRLHLMARENGEWKIWRRFAIYERDRVDPVDLTIGPEKYLDPKAMAKFPKQIRYHLWRNEVNGSAPSKNLCIRGTEQEKKVREEARKWIEGA
jgi:hypothetical protein